jgi:hypothetical protein
MTLKQTLNNIHISKTNYFNSNVIKNSNKSKKQQYIFDSIISVTPLSEPSGQLFYIDFIYDNTTNS